MKKWFTTLIVLSGIAMLYGCLDNETLGTGIPLSDREQHDPTPYEMPQPFRFPQMDMPADNPITVAGVELGRFLFYEKKLSIDSSMSCGTCHMQSVNFVDEGKALSVNVDGNDTKRNAPSIANTGWMREIFWDGRVNSLELVVEDAAIAELHVVWEDAIAKLEDDPVYPTLFQRAFPDGLISKENIEKAMAQFQRSAISYNSRLDQFLKDPSEFTAAEFRGFEIFTTEKGDCFHCHFSSPLMTDNDFHNNGLDSAVSINDFVDIGLGEVTGDVEDYGKFKTPTLRNIVYTAPYMHDGRFETLEEVIEFYSTGVRFSPTIDPLMKKANQGGLQLTAQEKSDLLAFLLTLTDDEFINNPEFSDPF